MVQGLHCRCVAVINSSLLSGPDSHRFLTLTLSLVVTSSGATYQGYRTKLEYQEAIEATRHRLEVLCNPNPNAIQS